MTQRIYLPSAAGTARVLPFGERKLAWSSSNRLPGTSLDACLIKMAGRIPSNRYLYNRGVSVHPTESEIGFGASTVDVNSFTTPQLVASLGFATPAAPTPVTHAAVLAALKAATGLDILSTGGVQTSFNALSTLNGYTSAHGCILWGDYLTGASNVNTNLRWMYHLPAALMEMTLAKFKKRWTGETSLYVKDNAGTVALFRYENPPDAMYQVPVQATLDRCALMGVPPPSASAIWFGNSYELTDIQCHGSVIHGIHPGVNRVVLDGLRTKITEIGGVCGIHRMAAILHEQRPLVPDYQNPKFDEYIANIYKSVDGLVHWTFYDELVNPVDLWEDPDIKEALDSPFTSRSDIEGTMIGGKTMKEWRDIILASPPRRLFYRGVQPAKASEIKQVSVTLSNAVYSFTSGGQSLIPSAGTFYTVTALPAGDPEAHLDAIRRQTGALMALATPSQVYGDAFVTSMASISESSVGKQWLYTVSSTVTIMQLAQTLAILGSLHKDALIEYL